MRILIVAPTAPGTLMASYRHALERLGHEVRALSVLQAAGESKSPWIRVSRVPFINRVGLDQVILEGNRIVARHGVGWRPDVVLVAGDDVLPGTIATLTGSGPCRTALVYPDPLTELRTHTIQSLALYNVVVYACGTFALRSFEALGARCTAFVPFAWDDALHPRPADWEPSGTSRRFDVVFIGDWRLDREQWLEGLHGSTVGIWGGSYWRHRTRPESVARRAWQGRTARGLDYVRTSLMGRITLNLVDELNGPGLNMRAFEAVGMGCFVLSHRTAAQEEFFVDGQHIVYFDTAVDLREKVTWYLAHPEERARIARNAAALAEQHTYVHRAQRLLELVMADQADNDGVRLWR